MKTMPASEQPFRGQNNPYKVVERVVRVLVEPYQTRNSLRRATD